MGRRRPSALPRRGFRHCLFEGHPSALRTSGDTVIDNAAGHLLINQQVVATWSSLDGTAADETVYAKVSGRVRATFGAGDDSLQADQAPRAGSVIDGGDGRDLVYITSEEGLLDLDLRRGKLVADAGSPYTTSATNFEDDSLFARRVVLGGTDGRNDRLLGGEGRDKLQGQAGKDRLYGGRSRDRADGGPGRKDLCRAEHERRCER